MGVSISDTRSIGRISRVQNVVIYKKLYLIIIPRKNLKSQTISRRTKGKPKKKALVLQVLSLYFQYFFDFGLKRLEKFGIFLEVLFDVFTALADFVTIVGKP